MTRKEALQEYVNNCIAIDKLMRANEMLEPVIFDDKRVTKVGRGQPREVIRKLAVSGDEFTLDQLRTMGLNPKGVANAIFRMTKQRIIRRVGRGAYKGTAAAAEAA